MAVAFTSENLTLSSLDLDISDFPGGVAIWGALPAVFDTTDQGFDKGVHVHARMSSVSKKVIDLTYHSVNAVFKDKHFYIDEEIAVNFTLASIFNHTIISLRCSHCDSPLLSKQIMSLIPHHEHICDHCGHINLTQDACVINPVVELKARMGDSLIKRKSILPARSIELDSGKYRGGIQIWGSNPSIIWTAARYEESAIHVHAYNREGKRIVDNTYSKVLLGDDELDIDMIRVLQIQQYIPELKKRVTVVSCPSCGCAQFDQGIYAVIAQAIKRCQQCARVFNNQEGKISNPASGILNRYRKELLNA